MRRTKHTNTRPPAHARAQRSMLIVAGVMSVVGVGGVGGCGFDSISIGFADPNPEDNFGQFVPPNERPTWEVQVWERPPEEDEDPEGANQSEEPEDPAAESTTTDDDAG